MFEDTRKVTRLELEIDQLGHGFFSNSWLTVLGLGSQRTVVMLNHLALTHVNPQIIWVSEVARTLSCRWWVI